MNLSPIGSAGFELLSYKQTDIQTDILLLYSKDDEKESFECGSEKDFQFIHAHFQICKSMISNIIMQVFISICKPKLISV